jgi:hypothetical protein
MKGVRRIVKKKALPGVPAPGMFARTYGRSFHAKAGLLAKEPESQLQDDKMTFLAPDEAASVFVPYADNPSLQNTIVNPR